MAFSDLIESADRAVQSHLGGELVRYSPEVGDSIYVTGVFDENYVTVAGDGMSGVEQIGPAIFFRKSDLPGDPSLDSPVITIRGCPYCVRQREPDSHGGIMLMLHRDLR